MTTREASELLGLSEVTIRLQIRLGVIAARKRGRDWWITPAAVERYRAEHQGRSGRPRKRG